MRTNDEIIDCIRANLISGNYSTILLDIEDNSTTRYKVIEVDLNDIPSDIRADFIKNPSSEKAINWLDKDILENINES